MNIEQKYNFKENPYSKSIQKFSIKFYKPEEPLRCEKNLDTRKQILMNLETHTKKQNTIKPESFFFCIENKISKNIFSKILIWKSRKMCHKKKIGLLILMYKKKSRFAELVTTHLSWNIVMRYGEVSALLKDSMKQNNIFIQQRIMHKFIKIKKKYFPKTIKH